MYPFWSMYWRSKNPPARAGMILRFANTQQTFRSPMPKMERVEILGVQIDNVTSEEALERIQEMICSRRPHQIVTPAIEQIVRARHDAEFNQVFAEADLVVPDGMQVVFASKLHKTPLKE